MLQFGYLIIDLFRLEEIMSRSYELCMTYLGNGEILNNN